MLTLGIVAGSGILGRGASPDGRSGASVRTTAVDASRAPADRAPADPASVEPSPVGGLPAPGAADSGTVTLVTVPGAGYRVVSAIDQAHPPTIEDRGALAVFGFGPRIGGETFDGTIQVAVGTAARGAFVAGRAGPAFVSGSTLEELRARYLQVAPGRVVTRSARELDGQLCVFIRIDDGAAGIRAVALVVHEGRTFVLTAIGFDRLFGALSDAPAEVALDRFLQGFSFATPPGPDER